MEVAHCIPPTLRLCFQNEVRRALLSVPEGTSTHLVPLCGALAITLPIMVPMIGAATLDANKSCTIPNEAILETRCCTWVDDLVHGRFEQYVPHCCKVWVVTGLRDLYPNEWAMHHSARLRFDLESK